MLLYILLFAVPQVGVLELMCCLPAEELGCYYISYCFLSQVGVLELMCCHPLRSLGVIIYLTVVCPTGRGVRADVLPSAEELGC